MKILIESDIKTMFKNTKILGLAFSFLIGINSTIYAASDMPMGLTPPSDKNDPRYTPVVQVVQKCLPAVVTIVAKNKAGDENISVSHGSGFIFDAKNGYILTNDHVVDEADGFDVVLYNDEIYKGELVSRTQFNDIAIIKINARNLVEVPLGDSSKLMLGEPAIAMGSPLNTRNTITYGIICGLNRTVNPDGIYKYYAIQTDAALNGGNSGGPLFNIKGEVIGINSAVKAGYVGMNFSIPINVVKQFIPSMLKESKVSMPYVGASFINEISDNKRSLGNTPEQGVIVYKTTTKGPAYNAGLKEGDLLTSIDGQILTNTQMLRDIIAKHNIGDALQCQFIRNGEKSTCSIILEAKPK